MFLRKRRRVQASSFSLYWEKIFSVLPERVGLGSITSPRGKWNECLAEDSRIEEFRSMQELAVKKEKQKNIEKQENNTANQGINLVYPDKSPFPAIFPLSCPL